MMPRIDLSCTVLVMAGLVGTATAEEPRESGRWLSASAHHEHDNRGPLRPTSPAGQGVHRVEGFRAYEASAVHPFLVGFYDCSPSGEIESAAVRFKQRHRHRDRELWVDVSLDEGCHP